MVSRREQDPAAVKQQFNVYLPPALIRRVKYRALDDQISVSELVAKALSQFLERPVS